jgi:hypothetical protein
LDGPVVGVSKAVCPEVPPGRPVHARARPKIVAAVNNKPRIRMVALSRTDINTLF